MKRWWTYQRERFPLLQHGPLIAVFSAAAVGYSSALRLHNAGDDALPSAGAFAAAFAVCFLLFLQLRIADEFKDFDEDSRWRPYRPVPRGLVRLRELAFVGFAAAALQAGAAAAIDLRLLLPLGITWAYLVLMTREFFVGDWLRRRPVVYMVSHMAILPLVDLFATACDWLPRTPEGGAPPAGLLPFLLASYFNGFVIEIGRKLRAPADEEPGVETYSVLWGPSRAAVVWLCALAATGGFAVWAAWNVGTHLWVAAAAGALWLFAVAAVVRFSRALAPGAGKRIEAVAGMWTIGLYAALGLLPLAQRWFA